MSPPRDSITVCIGFPADLTPEQQARVARLDPRLDVVPVPYVAPTEVRTARRLGPLSDALRARLPQLDGRGRAALARAEVLVALDTPEGLPQLAPRLRWIQGVGAGVGQFDERELDRAGITLTTAAGVAAVPIAEFVMGRLIEVWKDLALIQQQQREQRWARVPGRALAGCTLGIIGLGAIGRELAQRARAFDMRVIASRARPHAGQTSELVDELYGTDDLLKLLGSADAVVLAAPETERTRGMMSAEAFGAMRPGAVFCNVARGSLVDEGALLAALRRGRLRAAVLDVAQREPLPSGHPLWTAPGVLLSPHTSAASDGYADRLLDFFEDNLRRYLRGDALLNTVDFKAGY